jgi:hypothetical protein
MRRGEGSRPSFWGHLFLVAAPVYVVRFALLPDKLEYILPLVVVALLALVHGRFAHLWIAIAVVSLVASSAVSLSFFKREVGSDRLRVALGFAKGALAQDWDVTRANRLVTEPAFLEQVARLLYGDTYPRPTMEAPNFGIGITTSVNDLILGEEQLYLLDNRRFPWPKYQRRSYRQIFICKGSIVGPKPGWRVSQPPLTFLLLDPDTGNLIARCRSEGRANAPP